MRGQVNDQLSRWKSRKVVAALVRVGIFVVPLAFGFIAGKLIGNVLPEPNNMAGVILWWSAVILVATITATGVDHQARKLLPLTVLLKMTMLFPDRAPSRIQVARHSGSYIELKRRIAAAAESGNPDLGEISELILSLTAALAAHDRQTKGHSERTRLYTDMLATELGLPQEARDRLGWAALLHDVGKLEVPQDVLNKDGGLESAEWETMRQHPIYGMKIVRPLIPWLGEWAKTIEHHHERWDGSGYPYGLQGNAIHPGARIVAVADAYDVMTTGRPYQKALTPNQARREIAEMAGRQFDPAVARALMNVSIGRLRRALGPIASLLEVPFIRGLPQFGRDVMTIATSSAVIATALTAGIIATPGDVSPTDIVRSVVSGEVFVEFEVPPVPDDILISNQPIAENTPIDVPGTLPSPNGQTTTTQIGPIDNQPPVLLTANATALSGALTQIPIWVSDPDGDALTCYLQRAPEVGAASVPSDCLSVNYRAPSGFTGQVSLTIGIDDGTYLRPYRLDITVVPADGPSTTEPGTTTTSIPGTTTTYPGPSTTTTRPATTTTTTYPGPTSTTTTTTQATTTTTQATTTTTTTTTTEPVPVVVRNDPDGGGAYEITVGTSEYLPVTMNDDGVTKIVGLSGVDSSIGTVQIRNNILLLYTARAPGTDTFKYQAQGSTAWATVTVVVTPIGG